MSLTLVEAAKLYAGDPVRSAIIEIYARSSDILRVLPFNGIDGNAYKYNREETLPGIGFRGVNESYSESTGVLNPITEPLVIAGGDLDVDKFIIDTMGENQRSVHEAMKVKALSLNWTLKFIKGDQTSEPREFDGLQVRCTGNQLIAAGSTANGTPLSLAKLDELIDAVQDPQYLIMNKTMRRRLSAAARTTTVGGYISYDIDEFGKQVTKYNDLPILIADEDNTGAQILPFTEAATSGTSTATSIYCVSFGDGMLTGLENGGIDVRDLGELETKPALRTRVEWYNGIAVFHGKSVARLWSISNAAVTA
ncbi:MAG: major capsid protein [Candidatus Thorarchaeota archaeon]